MPVTARLSRKFYETFGDEIANELVEWLNTVDAAYRLDLKEFNETNFARFDAKLEQRLAEFGAKLEVRLAEFQVKFETGLAEFEVKLELRLGEMDAKWERRLADSEAWVARQLARFEVRMIRWMVGLWLATALGILGLYRL